MRKRKHDHITTIITIPAAIITTTTTNINKTIKNKDNVITIQ